MNPFKSCCDQRLEALTVGILAQELREDMSREVDEHQHELAALQDAQRQKMADVSRRHREELAEYEERIEELEEQIRSGWFWLCCFSC